MYVPGIDIVGQELCEPCMDLVIQDPLTYPGRARWTKCYWCWKWGQFWLERYRYCSEMHQPLCMPCFLDFHDGKEAPWRPNARTRLELLLPRLLKHATPLPDSCVRLITEFACPGWAT